MIHRGVVSFLRNSSVLMKFELLIGVSDSPTLMRLSAYLLPCRDDAAEEEPVSSNVSIQELG